MFRTVKIRSRKICLKSTKAGIILKSVSGEETRGAEFCHSPASLCSYGEAYFGSGTKLTVLEYDVKPPVVKVLGPSSRECRNLKDNERRKTLLCVASDFYPDHVSVSWRVGGQEVSRGVATDNAALRQGENYKITSRLRVSAEDWFKPETEFECIVSFFDGTGNTNHSASIFGGKAPDDVLTREKYLRITQKAKLSYGVFIVKSSIYGAFVVFLVWKLQTMSPFVSVSGVDRKAEQLRAEENQLLLHVNTFRFCHSPFVPVYNSAPNMLHTADEHAYSSYTLHPEC
ncbi:hypothetical protein F2P81_003051 [Scophthalmus maximus]|uniref:Ig-like domain-containing protein n=1 Tax=Scophthalmus maximus TaxID=52904 RepID=A0A6A4TD28_SCOMX|nr:hypothetical protein F2P81_003051 [Scophthalmus maximus]